MTTHSTTTTTTNYVMISSGVTTLLAASTTVFIIFQKHLFVPHSRIGLITSTFVGSLSFGTFCIATVTQYQQPVEPKTPPTTPSKKTDESPRLFTKKPPPRAIKVMPDEPTLPTILGNDLEQLNLENTFGPLASQLSTCVDHIMRITKTKNLDCKSDILLLANDQNLFHLFDVGTALLWRGTTFTKTQLQAQIQKAYPRPFAEKLAGTLAEMPDKFNSQKDLCNWLLEQEDKDLWSKALKAQIVIRLTPMLKELFTKLERDITVADQQCKQQIQKKLTAWAPEWFVSTAKMQIQPGHLLMSVCSTLSEDRLKSATSRLVFLFTDPATKQECISGQLHKIQEMIAKFFVPILKNSNHPIRSYCKPSVDCPWKQLEGFLCEFNKIAATLDDTSVHVIF